MKKARKTSKSTSAAKPSSTHGDASAQVVGRAISSSGHRLVTRDYKAVHADKILKDEVKRSKPYGVRVKKDKRFDQFVHSLVSPAHKLAAWPEDNAMRVEIIRYGMPSTVIYKMSRDLRIPKDQLYTTLALPRSTIERRIKDKQLLSSDHTERLLGLQSIIRTAQRIVEESGNPDGFNAPEWVGEWIQQPLPALGGTKPADMLDTVTGQRLVETLLERAQSGSYS